LWLANLDSLLLIGHVMRAIAIALAALVIAAVCVDSSSAWGGVVLTDYSTASAALTGSPVDQDTGTTGASASLLRSSSFILSATATSGSLAEIGVLHTFALAAAENFSGSFNISASANAFSQANFEDEIFISFPGHTFVDLFATLDIDRTISATPQASSSLSVETAIAGQILWLDQYSNGLTTGATSGQFSVLANTWLPVNGYMSTGASAAAYEPITVASAHADAYHTASLFLTLPAGATLESRGGGTYAPALATVPEASSICVWTVLAAMTFASRRRLWTLFK
jgi:hypothetical protein